MNENEPINARVRETVTSRLLNGNVLVEALQHEINTAGELLFLQSVLVSVRRGEEHRELSLSFDEAQRLYEALADLFEGRAPDGPDGGFDSTEEVDGLPVHPHLASKIDDWGGVDCLDDDELATPGELERCAIQDHWPGWLATLRSGKHVGPNTAEPRLT